MVTKIMMEPIEIPNTDLRVVRYASYTLVINRAGNVVTVAPPQWTLFEIEARVNTFDTGYKQGYRAGMEAGKRQARKAIMAAIGIPAEMDALRSEVMKARRIQDGRHSKFTCVDELHNMPSFEEFEDYDG